VLVDESSDDVELTRVFLPSLSQRVIEGHTLRAVAAVNVECEDKGSGSLLVIDSCEHRELSPLCHGGVGLRTLRRREVILHQYTYRYNGEQHDHDVCRHVQ